MKLKYDNKYVLIIGIDKYKYDNVPNLEYAEKDAKGIKEKLVNVFHYDEKNIYELYGEDATKENIENTIINIKENVREDDSFLIFFAGHGYSEDGIRKAVGYIIPYNGNDKNTFTMIQFDEIVNAFESIKCKHIFFIIDSCYSGLAIQRSVPGKRFVKNMMRRNVRQILTAGKGDQTVSDGDGPIKDHSIFTGYLLKALDGEAQLDMGIISANSVMAYVYNKVSADTKSKQTPNYGTIFGDGDYIFNDDIISDIENENNEEILVTIPSTSLDISYQGDQELIDEFKELLSSKESKIKVFDKVNMEIRRVKSQLELESKMGIFSVNNDNIVENVNKLNKIYNNLYIMIVLICYWGDREYDMIIKKIFESIGNSCSTNNGTMYGIAIAYYPIRVMYYLGFIASIEANNLNFIKVMADAKLSKSNLYHNENNWLITEQEEKTTKYYDIFKLLNDQENYYYAISHYIYTYIHPIVDNLLFLDNMYESKFLIAENLFSIVSAYYRYNSKNDYAWAQGGEFICKNEHNKDYFSEYFDTKLVADLNLFKDDEDKNKFKQAYLNMIESFRKQQF